MKAAVTVFLLNRDCERFRSSDLSGLNFKRPPPFQRQSKEDLARLSPAAVKKYETALAAAKAASLSTWTDNITELRKNVSRLRDNATELRNYLELAWAWNAGPPSNKSYADLSAEEKASRCSSRRKVFDAHLAVISEFQQFIRDEYLSQIPHDVFTVGGDVARAFGIDGWGLAQITMQLNAERRPGEK